MPHSTGIDCKGDHHRAPNHRDSPAKAGRNSTDPVRSPAFNTPQSMRMIVVLREPFGPSTLKMLTRGIGRVTFCTATK